MNFDYLSNKLNESNTFIYVGFISVVALAILGFAVFLIRGFDDMDPSWAISIGSEVLSLFVSAVVYYGFLHSKEANVKIRTIFSSLLAASSFCIFWDELSWIVQGIARFRILNLLSNIFLFNVSYMITLMFWEYLLFSFNIDTKLSRVTTKLLSLFLIPSFIVVFANLFYPIYFSVDSTGTYQRSEFYILHMIYYMIAIPPATIYIIKSKVSSTEKLAASTFYIFPILGIVISMFMFGISTSAICTMLPIVLNYFVIISNREKKFSITKNGLAIATDIQNGILPKSENAFPDRTEFDISASMKPALSIGGDFYDFFLVDDDHLAILVADVSDKGIPAALFMASSKVYLKTLIQNGGAPSDIIAYADKQISAENEAGMFVTLWLGIIDLTNGHVVACNAGHDYPAISSLSEGYKVEKTPHGPPISFIEGLDFPEIEFDLKPGESIFLYTDGLVEAKRKDGTRFGIERMCEVLNSSPHESGDEVIKKMTEAVKSFSEDEPQFDDITMLHFTYKGGNNS